MKNKLKEILPLRIYDILMKNISNDLIIEEIRIRSGRFAYIISSEKNISLPIVATKSEINDILAVISKNSLYAFKNTILNGYITLESGIRVGIIGRAGIENGDIVGVYDISEFAIRIPNKIRVNCSSILSLFASDEYVSGILIYSPPGEGKTTILRSLIYELSKGEFSKRVCVIDTRQELGFGIEDKHLLVSILSGYPRKLGIEIAIRTMNAQLIVCDEIGDVGDSSAIIDSQGAGVPLIATCHGKNLSDILSHQGILDLHNKKIFKYYIGIKRKENFDFEYTINDWRDANACL